ncbi:YfhO family protein [Candidatus Enterococcus mansonii]|uniref:Bacterial membrane protein YfhO n=1 Tax=Candidatus Enterococcus mansonii TaxID=1834181 RepID=A0A242CDL6_9ENTE|nr:YfhO family protein [Enterococcus sp. 4G2_DIV0659]OTO08208.1 hypothetical protein A5880_002478 [Enterococcus sp. 4G2_DIV0659]
MSKIKNNFLTGGSFLLPFLLLIILWSILGLAPFGNNTLLVSDLGSQYMPFLSAFKQFFQTGNHSLYSFSDALGGTILPLSAYYLLSPFNFLVLLFSYEQLPIAILLIITLKIAFMGTSMYYYLQKTYRETTVYTLLFSTSYSFCGFVTIYALNFMWLDALILLPLLVLGIQRLWDHKKYGLYSLVLFFAIVTNYYMGYMLCIFAVFYSFYWYYQQTLSTDKKGVWHFIKEGRLFFVASFLTGISTSFILIPAIEGMLATKKTSFDLDTFLPLPKFGLNFFSQLGIGSVNFELRLEHLPIIFSGLLMVLLFITYFQLSVIPRKEKWNTLVLIGLIFLSFWLEMVNTVWHMFQSPAGFPYRNSFIFSFLVIKFAYEAFIKLKQGATLKVFVPTIFSMLLLVGYLSLRFSKEKDFLLSNIYLFISLLGIWLIYCLIVLGQKSLGLKRHVLYSLLFLFVCSELIFNFWISLKEIPFGNQEKFAATYQAQDKVISELNEEQSDLFRLKQTIDSRTAGYNEQNNGYNNALLYGYAGVSSYTSTLDAKMQDTLTALGLYKKNDRRIAYVDEFKVINLLLNVAYQITPEHKEKQQIIATEPSTNVYKNPEAIGMGFLVPQGFRAIKLEKEQPLKNQEMILQTIQQKDTSYFKETRELKWTALSENQYTVTTKTTSDGELYLYAPEIDWQKMTSFTVNGKKIQPSVYIATNQLFNLGYFKKDETIQLQFDSEKELEDKNMEVKTLQQDLFDSFIAKQKSQAIQLNKQGSRTLTGEITVTDSNHTLLYLAIPYDKNWQITVDGKKIAAKRILGNFIGIELPIGKHQVAMNYQPKNFFIGSLISISVLLGVSFYQLIKRKSKQQ